MKHHIEILPSLLAANFARLGEEIALVEQAGARMLHYDVMDGRFVPNISMGIPVLESIRKVTGLWLDVHLMIVEPERHLAAFRQAGADSISVHYEACPHLHRTLGQIHELGARAGVVINPATPVHVLDEVLDLADFVLVMSVNPGYGGQKFIPSALHKVRQLDQTRRQRGLSFSIEMDGGVGLGNVGDMADAGCDWFVAGSSVFGSEDPAAAVRELHARACAGRQMLT
jgi:ribulose-phosphate 3-epimerase